ncbi:MerR family transcriptional regulator [Fervidicella metallireducens AeB]|uniref:MerR family transcriptional regulator n=1 Tax=Fervidicella metallireducens AeB TaxID=1403537 RepID=A0A017RUG3_9CLOT|nr:MerR family transcriptional regulator [Fervidicella metallireducens]EYE87520.1 MerR family transcriptional regulator [Fervidicella metallireducens AeB]
MYKIKEVADMVGISVRTLHHYDEIGLLKPESITQAGYRLYTEKNLEKLQQILFFKELDFDLKTIKEILDDPDFDRKRALELHRQLLIKKRDRLNKIIECVENTIESAERGIKMSKENMFNAFDMSEIEKYQKKYAEETKQKYGHTNAYKESMEKTSKYTKNDWSDIMQKASEIYIEIASLMDRSPDDEDVQRAVKKWRQYITDNFYNCTVDIFRGLGELYVSDERFKNNIDKIKEGLAEFLSEAIKIYCDK